MADEPLFVPSPRPVRFAPDGTPWPICPCGEHQASAPSWHGWHGCPCGAATGEITSLGTAHWILQDRPLVEQRRLARHTRTEAETAVRLQAKIR